ncbi:MAG: PAQR family membrane homeostasis protein TrhA [Brevibacterium yomogidense]|uniref:COG1272: Predicted membrane protein hemolysin III homolog n=1 Tax=Brevibacterium yomogidense TaxID=946573 RepID=A0A1X6X3B5_9MICO|nr:MULTISPECIES: hemolysin III family protein [Brevibacterium]SLM93196.1 COG1272: Predicted membrane protein hemolysin III homolog [Brevibacterium yomogidense]SMX85779.1 hemolysin III [Brevibacterium sp. Mu109]
MDLLEHPNDASSASAGDTALSDSPAAKPARGARKRTALRHELTKLAGQIRPSWRGWIHAGAFPVSLLGGLALIIVSPTIASRIAAAIFTVTGMLLFGTSAVYHAGRWRMRIRLMLRRFDHANIFLIIAGTYTPLAVLCLEGTAQTALLVTMWSAAIVGVLFRILWTTAPRWLFVPVYVGIGLAGVGYVPGIWMESLPVGILVVTGGALYIIGAVVYGLKRPNPAPTVFGFHEIFHTFTVLGYGCHLAALLVAASHAY